MSNIQVTHDTSVNNARSESNIAVNPNNPTQIVGGSKKFRDIHNYDFILAAEQVSDRKGNQCAQLAYQTFSGLLEFDTKEFTIISGSLSTESADVSPLRDFRTHGHYWTPRGWLVAATPWRPARCLPSAPRLHLFCLEGKARLALLPISPVVRDVIGPGAICCV
ncbi:hypothetical protein P3T25_006746 [Paraburkholderia sp. GAS32]